MTKYVEIGGKKRPVRFGWAGLLEYEQQTGRKALADFASFSGGLENVSITVMVDLVYYGLICGHRKAAVNVDFDKSDVADWIGADQDILTAVMESFTESFEHQGQEGNGLKGKPKAATPTR